MTSIEAHNLTNEIQKNNPYFSRIMDTSNNRPTQLYARNRPTLKQTMHKICKDYTKKRNQQRKKTKAQKQTQTNQSTKTKQQSDNGTNGNKAKTTQQQKTKQQQQGYPFFVLSDTPVGRSGPADRARAWC